MPDLEHISEYFPSYKKLDKTPKIFNEIKGDNIEN
jgi:hypothetical protein